MRYGSSPSPDDGSISSESSNSEVRDDITFWDEIDYDIAWLFIEDEELCGICMSNRRDCTMSSALNV